MRVDRAQALAADWLRAHGADGPRVVGAFFTGSTLEAAPGDELAAESDVDLTVVVDGPAPPKLGKLDHKGVRVEVTYLAWAELADPERVARTHYLAPSFGRDSVVSDPDGRLAWLTARVRPLYARPDVVGDRCELLLESMAAKPAPAATWAEAVTGWLFPTSLPALVVLVAALRNPTVRLRYLRAREVLETHGRTEHYPPMLAVLGCLDVTPSQVLTHLRGLADAFDAAAACGPTPHFFASDITPAARPIAIDGTARLVAQGEHREAVFWLLATFSRCLQILDATHAADRARHADAFAAAVVELAGVRTPEDLANRRAALRADIPALRALAGVMIGR